MMAALVEEAVTVGDLVRLFTFRRSAANLVEITLPDDSPYVGQLVRDVPWPVDVVLVAILRDGQIYTPEPARSLESNDELLLVAAEEHEDEIAQLLAPIEHPAPR
jgi:trk system potassium uptake protein TrkA